MTLLGGFTPHLLCRLLALTPDFLYQKGFNPQLRGLLTTILPLSSLDMFFQLLPPVLHSNMGQLPIHHFCHFYSGQFPFHHISSNAMSC